MNLVLWLSAGALVALLASCRASALSRQRLLADVMLAAIGALVAGPAVVPTAQWLSFDTNWRGFAAAAVGTGAVLLIARLFERRVGSGPA